jgi:hypothetical protein
MFGRGIEMVFRGGQRLFEGVETVKPSMKTEPVNGNKPAEPNKTNKKKRYSPPRFEVLTPDQAKSWLIEKGLPGETPTGQPLTAASLLEQHGTNEQRSIPGGAEPDRTK